MRICHACLVIIDISGYTRFITERSLTLEHAERIISDLIDAVIDRAQHPLILNKLEGDAALLYAEVDPGDTAAIREILAQVRSFFPAFSACVVKLSKMSRNCNCDACSNITSLSLKAFVHTGEILIKKIRQFEEVAGEPVILLHRMMKNNVQGKEYVLLSDVAVRDADIGESNLRSQVEQVDGMGRHQFWLANSEDLPSELGPMKAREDQPEVSRIGVYRNLPAATDSGNWISRWWNSLCK